MLDCFLYVIALNVNKLYLWTERGALLYAKSLNTDKAWEVYDKLVETYFRTKEIKEDINKLSPQLQLLINMEVEQKKIREQLTVAKEQTAAIKEEVTDYKSYSK